MRLFFKVGYSRLLFSMLLIAGLAACTTKPVERVKIPEEGFKYLETVHETATPDKIEVLVFFGYQCNHCFDLYQGELAEWIKSAPGDIAVRLVPTTWTDNVIEPNKAFHTAELLDITYEYHDLLFSAYNTGEVDVNSATALAELAEKCCDVDSETFRKQYRSSAVFDRAENAGDIIKEYEINSTPSVVINGRYYSKLSMVDSKNEFIDVINKIVEHERKYL